MTILESYPSSESLDSPEVGAAISDISLAVQRALLRIQQHRLGLGRIALPVALATVLTGPTGPTGARAA